MADNARSNPTVAWQRLVAAAVIGSERAGRALPPVEGGAGRFIEKATSLNSEEGMLHAAALLSVYERAGRRAPERAAGAGGACPPAVAGHPQDQPACSQRAGWHLSRILGGDHRSLLDEWCCAAAKAGVRAPDELMPRLLDEFVATKTDSERTAIAGVLGKRGRWLAASNPDWHSSMAPEDDPSAVWESGTRDQRLDLLRRLRASDPARGRELVMTTWEQDPPDDRAAFVDLFVEGLSIDDEPFLESVLDDNRKAVRTSAAETLARLPSSGLCRRMAERLAPLLSFKPARRGLLRSGKPSLDVALPESCDRAMARDGLQATSRTKLGAKANLLYQMLAASPLSAWSERWNVLVDQILDAAVGCEWKDACVQGWALAAVRQREAAWAEAILRTGYFSKVSDTPLVVGLMETIRGLLSCLSPPTREAIIAEILKDKPFPLHSHPVMHFLTAGHWPWSTEFSRAVLDVLRRHFQKHSEGYDGGLPRTVAAQFSKCIDPSLAQEAATGWPVDGPRWAPSHAEMVDTLTSVLQFRRDFLLELKP